MTELYLIAYTEECSVSWGSRDQWEGWCALTTEKLQV